MKNRLKNSLLLFVCTLFGVTSAFAQKTYVVCVGLVSYDDAGVQTLSCSDDDMNGVAKLFKSQKDSEVFMLLSKNATRDHIIRVLKNQFAKAEYQDEIIFAYSGHGFDGGITCYDTKNVIYNYEIQQIMRSSKAHRKIMFVDCCHSGSFSKKYVNNNNNSGNSDYKSRNSNVMLFLSCRANENSRESPSMKMSFFFSALVEALEGEADKNKDNNVTARELFNYVYAQVVYCTSNKQHPQMYGKFPDDMIIVKTK
jgi:uncharacterized caspase-like protein